MIRKEAKIGHVLAFDAPTIRSVAKELRESVDKKGARERLGVGVLVAKELLRTGVIAPLLNGRQWRRVFRVQDLDDLIRKICGDAPLVDGIPEGMMSASKAREHLDMSGGFFLKLILDGRLKTAARLSGAVGVSGVLVRESELRRAFIDLVGVADLPTPLAAVALTTTSLAVKRLLARGLLRKSKRDGRLLVAAASLDEFRHKYVGVSELVKIGGRPLERVRSCLAFMGIEQIPALAKCSFPAVSRPAIEARLDEFRSLARSDLRTVKAARRRQDVDAGRTNNAAA